jgi:hypothetical protein
MDFFLNMSNLGMNVVKVTAFKRFDFVNFVVPIIISLIEIAADQEVTEP